jgi:hypothetical protein
MTIELAQHRIYLPFIFEGRRYSFSITADHLDRGKSLTR